MGDKNFLRLSLVTFGIIFSLYSMQKQPSSSWCGLDIAAYKVGRLFGRNDYLYLAYANSVWFLQKKIALQENREDLDKYYARHKTILRTKNGSKTLCIYHTPLHEAVDQGNLECVKILCDARANPNKTIRINIEREEVAKESYYQSIATQEYRVPFDQVLLEVDKIQIKNFVGCSAIELARIYSETERPLMDQETSCLRKPRQDIYDYLQKIE